MGYNAENCKKVAEIYSNKNFNAQKEAEARREKLHMLFPERREAMRRKQAMLYYIEENYTICRAKHSDFFRLLEEVLMLILQECQQEREL